MAPNVFLAAVDRPDFDATVGSPVTVAEYPDPPDGLDTSSEVRIWGAPGSAESHFEKVAAGDLVLFVDDDSYVGAGVVGGTVDGQSDWARTNLWADTDSTLLYTLEEFAAVSVPKSAVNSIFDYDPGYSPGRLMRVAEARVTRRPAVIRRALEQYTDKHG